MLIGNNGNHTPEEAPGTLGTTFSEEIRRYLALGWRWSWLILLGILLGAGAFYYNSNRQERVYAATATILIREPPSSVGNTQQYYYQQIYYNSLAQTFSIMIVQQPVLDGVVKELGLDLTTASLGDISVEVIDFTQLLRVQVQNTDPRLAADIANTIGKVFAQQNDASQAATYEELKQNLSGQLEATSRQIEETSASLDALGDPDPEEGRRSQLAARLDIYKQTYKDLLETIVQLETGVEEGSTGQEDLDALNAQVDYFDGLIQETIAELELLPEGDEKRRQVQSRLDIYQQTYEELLGTVIKLEAGIGAETGLTSDDIASLNERLDYFDGLVQETQAELDALGGSTDNDSERARLESNLALYRQTYANLVRSFEEVRLAEIVASSRVELVEPAQIPGGPIRPNPRQDALYGAVIGLVAALALVFLIEILNDTFKGPDEIARHLGLPVLALINHFDENVELPISHLTPRAPIAEAFRTLRTNISYASVDRPIRTIMVTSPLPREGKSTITANLGVVFAQKQQQVAILDGDLRQPTIHKVFNTTNREGMSNLLVQPELDLNGQMQESAIPYLKLITSGKLPPNPAELISSNKMLALIEAVKSNADLVLIDTPPVNAVTDSAILASRVDGVILVIRLGTTKITPARQAVEQLRRTGANILGVVLNDADNMSGRYYYYYSGRYYYAARDYNDPEYQNGGSRLRRKKKAYEKKGSG